MTTGSCSPCRPPIRWPAKPDGATRLLAQERLLLLEEGHCLRDQALSYCQHVERGATSSFGASSLSTIIQMVANGLGITLLPELSLPFEVHDPRIALLPFAAPEPIRTVALAWRRSSPRKRDFVELARLLTASRPGALVAVPSGGRDAQARDVPARGPGPALTLREPRRIAT